jgi:predicted nuclease of predicted toxin-antitoxin system
MASGTERTFNDVLDYTLSKDAKTLVFAVSSKKEEANGVYSVAPQSDAAAVTLLAGKGKYEKLSWEEDQTELAFISDKDDAESKQPKFKVYLWNRNSSAPTVVEGSGRSPTSRGPQAGSPAGVADKESSDRNHTTTVGVTSATEIVSTSSAGFRKDFVVSEKANLSFSLDGSHLFLGAAPPPEPEKNPDEDIPADEKVLVDLWHWKDDYIQPIQKIRAEQDRNRSYRAVYLVKDKKFVQLADESMETISPSKRSELELQTVPTVGRCFSGLKPDDRTVWEYAKANGFILVSQDADFADMATLYGPPPKVIWLRCGNQPTKTIEQRLRDHAEAITAFEIDEAAACWEIY